MADFYEPGNRLVWGLCADLALPWTLAEPVAGFERASFVRWEWGTDTDGNLLDALLTGAKRIGHGFALATHPYIMAHMKKQNICLEVCPISNEILGLTPRIKGHTMYSLLANDVHCTVNSDNGTLFRLVNTRSPLFLYEYI